MCRAIPARPVGCLCRCRVTRNAAFGNDHGPQIGTGDKMGNRANFPGFEARNAVRSQYSWWRRPQCARWSASDLQRQTPRRFFSQWLLRQWTAGPDVARGMRESNEGVSRVFSLARKRSCHAAPRIRFPRTEAWRLLVPMRRTLARGAARRRRAAGSARRNARSRAGDRLAR